MSKKTKCSECGTTANVKPARDYPALAELLAAWNSLESSGHTLLCPACAAAVCGDLRGDTIQVYPLDLRGEDPGPDQA